MNAEKKRRKRNTFVGLKRRDWSKWARDMKYAMKEWGAEAHKLNIPLSGDIAYMMQKDLEQALTEKGCDDKQRHEVADNIQTLWALKLKAEYGLIDER